MSSLSGLDHNAALNLNVTLVLPESLKEKYGNSLEGLDVIYLEKLKHPSFIATGGLNINMQLDSIKAMFQKNNMLSGIFGFKEYMLNKAEEFQEKIDQKIDNLYTKVVPVDISSASDSQDIPDYFFRYSRPGDPKNEWRPMPTGGVCFLIQILPQQKKILFSVSICNPKDRFDRRIARKIAEQRMSGQQHYVLENYDLEMPVLWNIKRAAENYLKNKEDRDTLKPMFSQVPTYGRERKEEYKNYTPQSEVAIIYQRT